MNRRRALLTALMGALAPTVAKITPSLASGGVVKGAATIGNGLPEAFIGSHTIIDGSKIVSGTITADRITVSADRFRFSDANWPGNRTYTPEEYFAIKDWEYYFGPWTG